MRLKPPSFSSGGTIVGVEQRGTEFRVLLGLGKADIIEAEDGQMVAYVSMTPQSAVNTARSLVDAAGSARRGELIDE
jgi:hypothetical protein